ncbi:MAG: FecR domain-containing protein [Candidatus Marinimicrobia bacterium]|nr:FecR domain-containing protein [Candidatus Neomarinimicrobiota bacterium]
MRKHNRTFYKVILISLYFINISFGESVARLIKSEGVVYLKRMGMQTYSEVAQVGASINNGDAIKVGDYGFAALIFIDDRSVVKVKPNSQFEIMDTKNTRSVNIEFGTILNKIEKENRTKTFRVVSPVSVASVKGTEFAAMINPSGVDQFIGKEGLFDVFNSVSGQTVSVGPGQKALSGSTGSLMQAPASPNEYPQDPELELEAEERKKPSERDESKKIENDNQQKEVETNDSEIKNKTDQINDSTINNEVDSNDSPKTDDAPSAPKKPFGMGLGIGSATIDGTLYNQLALRPEINFAGIGIGLDLVVYMDDEGNIRQDEWDFDDNPDLIYDKILYVRYGEKSSPIWAKYGSIENMTLGQGGLMKGYSNMMEFPTVRRVGINTGFNIGSIGGEVFLSNIKDLSRGGTIFGLRAQYKISDNLPITIGLNYISDANMFSAMKDKDGDSFPDVFDDFPTDSTLWNDTDGDGWADPGHGLSVPDSLIDIDADGDNIVDTIDDSVMIKARPFSINDNKASVSAWSFDVSYPVLTSKMLSLTVYTEFNSLMFPEVSTIGESSDTLFYRPERSGSGITLPGIRSKLFGLLDLSLEYRSVQGSYVPQFFDQAYDLNRVLSVSQGTSTTVKTKDMSIFEDYDNKASSSGVYGSANMSILNLLNFNASYASMKADTLEFNSFNSVLTLNTDNIPKLSVATAFYRRNNDKDPFDFKNPSANTVMGYRVGYEMSKGVSLIWEYSEFYRDNGSGELEPIRQTKVETAFSF